MTNLFFFNNLFFWIIDFVSLTQGCDTLFPISIVLSHHFLPHVFLPHVSSWMKLGQIGFKPRTAECWDLNTISGLLVGWKDPTNPKVECDSSPNEGKYFIHISGQTMFLFLFNHFQWFQTHWEGYSSQH